MSGIAVQGVIGNPGQKATTEISHSFNSMATINGVDIGANSSGLFLLNSGAKDDSVVFTRSFTLVTTDFGDNHPKHLRYLYLGVLTDNNFNISFKVDRQESKILQVDYLKSGLQQIRVENIYPDVGVYWTITVYSKYFLRVDSIKALFYRTSYGNI